MLFIFTVLEYLFILIFLLIAVLTQSVLIKSLMFFVIGFFVGRWIQRIKYNKIESGAL